jgi:hypothetical protein
MFERVAQTPEQLDAEAREGRSEDQIAALRLAAVLILIDTVLTIAFHAAYGTIAQSGAMLGTVVRLVLAYYLFKLRPRAEALALGLTILGAVVVLFTTAGLVMKARSGLPVLLAVPGIGSVAALLLLLRGDPSKSKRTAAIVIFVLTVCLPVLALIVLRFTGIPGAQATPV